MANATIARRRVAQLKADLERLADGGLELGRWSRPSLTVARIIIGHYRLTEDEAAALLSCAVRGTGVTGRRKIPNDDQAQAALEAVGEVLVVETEGVYNDIRFHIDPSTPPEAPVTSTSPHLDDDQDALLGGDDLSRRWRHPRRGAAPKSLQRQGVVARVTSSPGVNPIDDTLPRHGSPGSSAVALERIRTGLARPAVPRLVPQPVAWRSDRGQALRVGSCA